MIINDGRKADGDPTSAPVVKAAASAPATPEVKGDDLQTLLQLLVQREAREARKEQKIEDAKKQRDAQYLRNAGDDMATNLQRWGRCQHLKGGRHRNKGHIDYALEMHTFIDHSSKIRCGLCGMNWYGTDTIEKIIRGGTVYDNPTKWGWREALIKVQTESTNTPSYSERIMDIKPAQVEVAK